MSYAEGAIPTPPNLTWLTPPPSNLQDSNSLSSFTYLFTDSSIKILKNNVNLIYSYKNRVNDITGGASNILSCQSGCAFNCSLSSPSLGCGFDTSYPYNMPLSKVFVNLEQDDPNVFNTKVISRCNNSSHLYYYVNGQWEYSNGDNMSGANPQQNNKIHLGEFCGNVDQASSCLLGVNGVGSCGSQGSSCVNGTDWGFNNNSTYFHDIADNPQLNWPDNSWFFTKALGEKVNNPPLAIHSLKFPHTLIASNRNIHWDNQDLTNFPIQWIYCTYIYDYTGYTYNNTVGSAGPYGLNKWFIDVYTPVNNKSASDATRFLNSTFILSLIHI